MVACDMRGHGDSTAPAAACDAYCAQSLSADLLSLIIELARDPLDPTALKPYSPKHDELQPNWFCGRPAHHRTGVRTLHRKTP